MYQRQLRESLALAGAHDARLDDVHGTTNRRRHKTGRKGRCEMRRSTVLHGRVCQQSTLDAVVARELAGRHQRRTHAVGPDAAPERLGAFLAYHADHAINRILVFALFGGRERGVVLHAHVEHISWVAGNTTKEAGGGRQRDEGGHGGTGALGDVCFHVFVDAESHGGVGELAEEGSRELQVCQLKPPLNRRKEE